MRDLWPSPTKAVVCPLTQLEVNQGWTLYLPGAPLTDGAPTTTLRAWPASWAPALFSRPFFSLLLGISAFNSPLHLVPAWQLWGRLAVVGCWL